MWLVASLAALLHIAPYWRAQTQTPPGWTFTGNLHSSPDFMQYRAWAWQAQRSGVLVPNNFTSEPNRPHLPVLLYYGLGQLSRWTGTSPELIFAYAGSLFAFALTLLLFAAVRHFLRSPGPTWWVFLAILVGGGLGAHLKLLSRFGVVRENLVLRRLVVEPTAGWPHWGLFEDFREHYVFITLFDTHFALVWLVASAAVLSLYFTLRRFSAGRLLATAGLWAFTTLFHPYEGVTLTMIAAGVTLLCWRKRLALRPALASLAVCAVSVAVCLAFLAFLHHRSGLPLPPWRGPNLLASILLIAYPLGWPILGWGLSGYWRRGGLDECFLLGWLLGCTALALSGPFYPHPQRGVLTLAIPLHIVAGTVYFSRRTRVTWRAALVAVFLLGATPAFMLRNRWEGSRFVIDEPFRFMSAAHREIEELLEQRASEGDLLIADQADLLWLAPRYPGKHYCGHYFLTVDYERKCAELDRFFESSPTEQVAFLKRVGARFLYVSREREPERFKRVPGLKLLGATEAGALFERSPRDAAVTRGLPAREAAVFPAARERR